MTPRGWSGLRSLLLFAQVAVASFGFAYASVTLTRFGLPVATIWPVNIVVVLLALRVPRPSIWPKVLGAMLGIGLSNGLSDVALWPNLGMTAANGVELFITLGLLRRAVGPWRWTPAQLVRAVVLAAFVGPAIAAFFGAAVLAVFFGVSPLTAWLTWFASSAVAVVTVLPAAWLLITLGVDEEVARWRSAALWAFTVGSVLLVFSPLKLPLLFLPVLPLVRFGMIGLPRQGVMALLLVVVCTALATYFDLGPIGEIVHEERRGITIAVLHAYILTLSFTVFPSGWQLMRLRQVRDSLASSEAIATRASLAKSEFLATMSHELRTPLAGVVGFAQLLKETPLSATQRSYVERIEVGSEHLQLVIGDVLDLSAIEAGRLSLRPSVVDVRELIYACVGLVEGQVEVGVSVSGVVSASVPSHVEVDEGRLRQVMMNLLSNAAKFTSVGRVTLSVHLDPKDAELLVFTVQDTGCGIPTDMLADVFGRFQQVRGSTRRVHGGSGLGLPIANKLVQAMGGELSLESELKVGTLARVRLRLPVAAPPEPTEEDEGPRESSFNLRVLLVDDDPIMNELMRLKLCRLGCDVVCSLHPAEAVALALAQPFDLLLTDLHMPNMDGFGLLRRVREGRPELRAVLLTVDATPEARRIAQVAGFQRTLIKPVSDEDLDAALADAPLSIPEDEVDGDVIDLDHDALYELNLVIGAQELRAILERSLGRFEDMVAALEGPDVPLADVVAAAHQIKGTAGSLGMPLVQGCAAMLEDATLAKHDIAPHLRALRQAIEAARAEAAAAGLLGPEQPGPSARPGGLRLIKGDLDT